MKKGDVIRQKCVNTTFYLTGILAHKVNVYSLRPSTQQVINLLKKRINLLPTCMSALLLSTICFDGTTIIGIFLALR